MCAALNVNVCVVQPGSMGCGASKPDPSSSSGVVDPASSMLCDLCQNKFTLLNRKVNYFSAKKSVLVTGRI